MTVTVKPSVAVGSSIAPPSKSVAHRALICGALTEKSIIKNIALSKDIEATLSCLKALGANVNFISDTELEIGGLNPFEIPENAELNCNESGSTLRFLIPLCLLCGKRVKFTGSERLFERPLTVYEEIAEQNGFTFERSTNFLTLCGRLKAGEYFVAGDISSQFITGLLIALSCLVENSQIKIKGRLESASYLDITTSVMNEFGASCQRSENSFTVKPAAYIGKEYTVEGDCSNAAFLEAFNLLGGNVRVLGIPELTAQGDIVYKSFFAELKNGKKEFDLSDCPDLAPVMFAASSVFGGAKFTGTKRLKIKESDRAVAMAEELEKFGIKTVIGENSVVISGELKKPSKPLCGHNDHRIVMALSLLCTLKGGTVTEAEAVSKSFPDFFDKLKTLGIGIIYNET